jgi:DUF1016 N-terminal domain
MTATYWEIGRRIVEFEQGGEKRAEYGKALLERLSNELTARYGRGFARPNLIRFRQFYSAFPDTAIRSTALNRLEPRDLARAFPLPWSSYVLLISRARSPEAGGSTVLSPSPTLSGDFRFEAGSVHACGCRANAHVSELCERALGATRRKPACRRRSLQRQRRGAGALCDDCAAHEAARPGIPDSIAG